MCVQPFIINAIYSRLLAVKLVAAMIMLAQMCTFIEIVLPVGAALVTGPPISKTSASLTAQQRTFVPRVPDTKMLAWGARY
jgi:hypothetical protein